MYAPENDVTARACSIRICSNDRARDEPARIRGRLHVLRDKAELGSQAGNGALSAADDLSGSSAFTIRRSRIRPGRSGTGCFRAAACRSRRTRPGRQAPGARLCRDIVTYTLLRRRAISAQVLRIAVYTHEQATFINMANPVAHAMVFYANSSNYDAMLVRLRK